MRWSVTGKVVLEVVLTFGAWQFLEKSATAQKQQQPIGAPIFEVDSSWPKMEGNWIFGSIGGIGIDPKNDHVWVIQRPGTLDKDENYAAQTPPRASCCVPARETLTPSGTAGSLALSADKAQSFLYVTGGDDILRILNRETLQPVGTVGRLGHYPGQFYHLHVIAVDSKGNIYTGENTGKRVQKFLFKGFSSKSAQ